MTFKMVRRSLAATAVLAAIATPSAMACHGGYTPPQTGDHGTPSGKTRTSASYGGHHHHRDRSARDFDRTPTPPPVDQTDPTVPVDPGTGSSF